MKLPEEMNFSKIIHDANERIPVKALDFGSDAVYRALVYR